MSAGVVWRGVLGLLLAVGLAGPSPGIAALPAGAVFWTAPAEVVAGEESELLTTGPLACGGQASVERDGEQLHILVEVADDAICFGAPVPGLVHVRLPPLDAGVYSVDLVETRDGEPLRDPLALPDLEVSLGTATEDIQPAEGFWSVAERPGSGLFIERRNGLLAVAVYTFLAPPLAPGPQWMLGTGPLRGDAAVMGTPGYYDGSCFGCEPYVAPFASPTSRFPEALRMRFESARRAWVDFSDGSTLGFVSTPYGVDYIAPLADEVDADFGTLSLPDLEGTWVFAIEGEDGEDVGTSVRRLGAPQVVEGSDPLRVEFDGASASGFSCQAASEDQRAGCTYTPSLIFDPPPPQPNQVFYEGPWFIPLGDIEEDRMRGIIEADGQRWRIRGFRVPGNDAAVAR